MKKKFFIPFFLLAHLCSAQGKQHTNTSHKRYLVTLNAEIPIGNFSGTHSFGGGIDISSSYTLRDSATKHKFLFAYGAGVNYFIGKKVTVSQYSYKYPRFISAYLLGGVTGKLFIPQLAASILIGPALGIYNGSDRFNIAGRFETLYFFRKKFAAGTAINFIVEPGTDMFWTIGLKAGIQL
jgi:hypothetical protein